MLMSPSLARGVAREGAWCLAVRSGIPYLGTMPRIDAPELEDFPWFPAHLRDAMTGFLRVASEVVGLSALAAPLVLRAMERGGTSNIVDLCSGGGGPGLSLVSRLRKRHGCPARVTLTDLYPNEDAFERAERDAPGFVRGYRGSLSATSVPESLPGVRTIFNALHHLPKDVATAVLADAAEKRQPILTFEVVERSMQGAAIAALVPVGVFALMPFVKPMKASHLALTYVAPVLPAVIAWDGFASCLRSYSIDELREMTRVAARPGYTFEIVRTRVPYRPMYVTSVVGLPT